MTKRLEKLRDQVAALCDETEVPEPAEFLTSLMAGIDPRPRNAYIKSLVNAAIRANDGNPYEPPSSEDWYDIVEHVRDSGLYENESVSLETSEKAATKLMDYLHAKLRSIEVSGEMTHNHKITPLDDDEIRRFKAIWNEEF